MVSLSSSMRILLSNLLPLLSSNFFSLSSKLSLRSTKVSLSSKVSLNSKLSLGSTQVNTSLGKFRCLSKVSLSKISSLGSMISSLGSMVSSLSISILSKVSLSNSSSNRLCLSSLSRLANSLSNSSSNRLCLSSLSNNSNPRFSKSPRLSPRFRMISSWHSKLLLSRNGAESVIARSQEPRFSPEMQKLQKAGVESLTPLKSS